MIPQGIETRPGASTSFVVSHVPHFAIPVRKKARTTRQDRKGKSIRGGLVHAAGKSPNDPSRRRRKMLLIPFPRKHYALGEGEGGRN